MTHSFGRNDELRRQAAYDRQVQQLASGLRKGLANDNAIPRSRSRLTRLQAKLHGSLFAYCGPRLAFDAAMPDLDDVVSGVDRKTPRRLVADRVRKAMRGKVARDADLSDIEMLLKALEDDCYEDEDDESYDAEVEPEDYNDPEARDRRRMSRDEPPPFEGRPQPGGRMDYMSGEGRNDVRFPSGGTPAEQGPQDTRRSTTDKLPHMVRAGDRTRARRMGSDAALSFSERFSFASRHTIAGGGDKKTECM